MAGNFFRGTTADQDPRWGKSDMRLLKKLKCAPILDVKVDLNRVNLDVMARWVTEKVTELLGFEDEILVGTIVNNLQSKNVNPRQLQLDVTGFLEVNAASFMEELWTLLVDAQANPSGIPTLFLEKKKQELIARQRNGRTTAEDMQRQIQTRVGTSSENRSERKQETGEREQKERQESTTTTTTTSSRRRDDVDRPHGRRDSRSRERHHTRRARSDSRERQHRDRRRSRSRSRDRRRHRHNSSDKRRDESSSEDEEEREERRRERRRRREEREKEREREREREKDESPQEDKHSDDAGR